MHRATCKDVMIVMQVFILNLAFTEEQDKNLLLTRFQ